MNKAQRVVAGIVLISTGIVSFIFAGIIPLVRVSNFYMYMFRTYPMIILGILFIGGGIFALVSKKRR